MKYVMFEVRHGDLIRKIPIIFPNFLSHVDVAGGVQMMCPELAEATPVNAGSVSSLDIDVTTSEHSVTLGLPSDPRDASTIKMHDYMHGIVEA